MAVAFETIAESFRRLRAYILHDLSLIISAPTGGNYAAVLVVTSACEALGRLRFGTESGGGRFFGEYLLPVDWRSVANQLYDAVRNGLTHAYETKTILQIGPHPVELVISWKEKKHLSYEIDKAQLFLNVQVLVDDLRRAFDRYEEELRSQPALRDQYYSWMPRKTTVAITQATDQKAWKRLLFLAGESSHS